MKRISHWDREASGYDTKEAHSINIKSVGNIRDEKGGIVYNAIFNYYKYLQTVNKLMRK